MEYVLILIAAILLYDIFLYFLGRDSWQSWYYVPPAKLFSARYGKHAYYWSTFVIAFIVLGLLYIFR